MSAECHVHGCDLTYPEGSWPVGSCPRCEAESEVAVLRAERDEARVRLAVFMDVADQTAKGEQDGSWFRALLHKRLGDLGPEYEVRAYLEAMAAGDAAERRAEALEQALRGLYEAADSVLAVDAIAVIETGPSLDRLAAALKPCRAALAGPVGDEQQ